MEKFNKKYLKDLKKELLLITGVDVEFKSRKQNNVFVKSLYCQLALDKTRFSDDDIASSIGLTRTMVLHYKENVFPQIERHRKDLYDVYVCLLNDVKVSSIKANNILDVYSRLKEAEEQINKIKEITKLGSIIDLRNYIKTI